MTRNLVKSWTQQVLKGTLPWTRDISLVCKGGEILFWSKPLLATWSTVVTEESEELQMADFDAKHVELALRWSAQGKVEVNGACELSEVLTVLLALGSTAEIEYNRVVSKRSLSEGEDKGNLCYEVHLYQGFS